MHEEPSQEEKPKVRLLRRWSDMPQHLQFNPHIRTGYRPLMTVGQCLRSLFYIHNETVNIITHGFAILYMLLTIPQLLPWNTKGAIPMMAATIHCLPDIYWYFCMFIYCFFCIWGLLKAMNARSPWERRLCFAPLFLMRMLMMTLRYLGISGGSPDALLHIVLQDLVAVVGAIIGALRIPEKWIPGKLDLMLNSHNLMHVLVVLAICSMHAATLQDLAWISDSSACNKTILDQLKHDEL
ncbi:progestin and adipoQ receptor family member 4 isoform X2 [Bombus bifarius]|uniref:Progestin and adipoQ receptor family member 4 isoform X2 n=1 Tax=Bombus bifarius TaxID=103933 RepID=A0A6P8LIQ3_9HYME|nr:progestin and adipoQ receptor family member 4 isoform X2 [Bombus vancouverensis nearcticus]XP_033300236.1 progestin and adipoQ receptor family member 4 isoform X2 [Bombus bifarius]